MPTSYRRSVFDTKSHSWREVGLARQLSAQAVKRARMELLVGALVLAGTLYVYVRRRELLGADEELARLGTVVVLLVIGWFVARDVARALRPQLFRRLDPGRAGTVGFLIRLATLLVAVYAALRIAGLDARSLVVGGAATVVFLGLAAQQTLGNLIAGIVLLAAQPFRVGDRVRLQGGDLAGELEGTVSSLGLLHTVLANGEDQILVPNRTVLAVAIIPLREPAAVDLRARLRPGVTPLDVETLLREAIETPTRGAPRITLEELDPDELVVRISATPERASDGPRLASEVLNAIAPETRRVESRPPPVPEAT